MPRERPLTRRWLGSPPGSCWRSPDHPDPEGESLLLMADALQACYRKKKKGGRYSAFPSEANLPFFFSR